MKFNIWQKKGSGIGSEEKFIISGIRGLWSDVMIGSSGGPVDQGTWHWMGETRDPYNMEPDINTILTSGS